MSTRGAGPPPPGMRVVRRRRTVQGGAMRSRRRRVLLAAAVLTLAGAGAAAWLGVTGLHARTELQAALDHAQQARTAILAGDATTAGDQVRAAGAAAAGADASVHALPWDVLAAVPGLGRPARAAQALTAAVDDVTGQVLPPAVDTGAALAPSRLRPTGGRIDLAALAAAAPALDRASAAADRVQQEVQRIPSAGYVGALDRASGELGSEVDQLAGLLRGTATAARLAPAMLGGDGPRSYFVAFQTNAEARGTGGLVGAYGILRADQGSVHLDGAAADTALVNAPPPGIDLGADYDGLYGRYAPTTSWVNSNLSADFPSAAQVWTSLWARTHAAPLDGAVATDPVALGYLLGAVGPVTLPGGDVVTADDVVDLTESRAYVRFPDNAARKAYLQSIASAVLGRVLAGGGTDTTAVLAALGRAAGEGRLAVWSAHPDEERTLVDTPLGRQVPDDAAPYAGLTVNNSANGKLDYYLGRSLHYTAGSCAGTTRTSAITVDLTNGAPTTGLPGYVTIQNNGPAGVPGTNRSHVSVYATTGAQLAGATLDGAPVPAAVGTERGHPVYTVDVQLAPGARAELVLDLVEPVVPGAARVPVQPLVQPMAVSTAVPDCTAAP